MARELLFPPGRGSSLSQTQAFRSVYSKLLHFCVDLLKEAFGVGCGHGPVFTKLPPDGSRTTFPYGSADSLSRTADDPVVLEMRAVAVAETQTACIYRCSDDIERHLVQTGMCSINSACI